jgi:hypothetical protein
MSSSMVDEFHSMNFSCYSTSKAGLFKWNSGCMRPKYKGNHRDKGNIFCASRSRAPLLTLAYDALSFPAMLNMVRYRNDSNIYNSTELASKTDSLDLLKKSFILWQPFCRPWPKCANT